MPAITVMTTTDRDLWMDKTIDCLKHQTFRDFEWVLSDDLYEQRKEKVGGMVRGSFPVIHRPPNKFSEYSHVGEEQNDALLCVNGELIYFMSDYILIFPDVLQKFWDLHQRFPKALLSGKCIEATFLPPRIPAQGEQFSGQDYREQLFRQNFFRWDRIEEKLYEAYRDGVQNWWGGRNDAAPLEDILECNGFDEQLDGGYGYHDDDLAQRLMTYGCKYYLDMSAVALWFPHERAHEIPGRKKYRSWSDQQWFKNVKIPHNIKNHIYRANEHRNLKEERCARQSV